MAVTLRELRDEDLDRLFVWEQDPEAVRLAAFTAPDPSDRVRFDAHYAKVRADPSVLMFAIDDDDDLVGMIASFDMDGERELTYWVDPGRWGRRIATAAMAAFLAREPTRPIRARIAEHNAGSRRVVEKAGFAADGRESGWADGAGAEVVEIIYHLV